MHYRRRTSLSAICGFVALASCGDEGSSDLASACERYARNYCETTVECDLGASLYIDPATCVERFTLLCETGFSLDGTDVTPEELDTCSASITDALCGGSYSALFDVCYPLLAGTRPEGAPCVSLTQCAGGWCDIGDDAVCGVCLSLPAAGEPCPDGRCVFSAVCSEGTCTAIEFVEDGAPCDPPAVQCNVRSACSDGVCAPLPGEGQPCLSGRCQLGLDCDRDMGLCVSGAPPAAVGEPCGVDVEIGRYVSCDASAYCADGVCAARVPDGGSCTESSQCMLGAQCMAGTCQIGFPMCE